MSKTHQYSVDLLWTGNRGEGTTRYTGYERSYTLHVAGKPDITGSSDPAFRGDPRYHNPEELFLASLSSCHMLQFLHECAKAGVSVIAYVDHAKGFMEETAEGGGRFTEVVLHPTVTVALGSMVAKVEVLHNAAHHHCFIANSCNFPVRHLGTCSAIE
jgi:organic hydroperoxide reductase OsmC/OhrA